MKKVIAAAVFTALINPSLYSMKRAIVADSEQPNKKCKEQETASNPASMSLLKQREYAFDTFMMMNEMEQHIPEQEMQKLLNEFVIENVVDANNKNAKLLKSYHDIMFMNSRAPKKIIRENGEIDFI
jgi:hypothetical protein